MTTTTLPTTRHYDVLNAVVLKQLAAGAAVSEATGVGVDEVEAVLADLSAAGLVFLTDGRALPTDTAAATLAEVASERYAPARADNRVLGEVERFEDTNTRLLGAMTAWQTLEVGGRHVPNDHADAAYDDRVISRVERLVRRLDPLLDALVVHDSRFSLYRNRFHAALEAVDRGETEYVSSPMQDSVHTIWFEFHEDLLRTLGRRRTE